MVYTSLRVPNYLKFGVLLAASLLLYLPGHAQVTPQLATPASRAAAYTRRLTKELRLYPHQYPVVYRCTLRELTSLDSLASQAAPTVAYAHLEAGYQAALLPVLTGPQHLAFVLHRAHRSTPFTAASTALL